MKGDQQIVSPSKVISSSYSLKAENALKAAKLLLEQMLLEKATTMVYYAMFHKATALLRLVGITCENHTGTIMIMQELFGIDTHDFSFAKKERVDKQYYPDVLVIKGEVSDLIRKAERFIGVVGLFMDRLTPMNAKHYQERLNEQL